MNFCHIFLNGSKRFDQNNYEKKKLCISQETFEGLTIADMSFLYTITKYDLYVYKDIHFTVLFFGELGPTLLNCGHYLLTEVLCEDPLKRYFSQQRHRGG